MKRNKHKKLWVPAMLTLAAFTALPGCGTPSVQGAAGGETPVKTIKLGQTSEAGLSGKIIPDQEVKVVSKVAGKVSAIQVEEGAKVKKGDVLLQLETDDLTQQVKQAEAGVTAAEAKLNDAEAGARSQEIQGLESAVQQAQAALDTANAAADQAKAGFDLAQSTYNRLRNLYDTSSTVAKEDLERGTLDYEKARAGYSQAVASQKSAAAAVQGAKAKLELAKIGPTDNTIKAMQADIERLNAGLTLANSALSNATVTAPIDGIVVKKSIQAGEMASPGVPLFSVVAMDHVQVELSVADNQIGSIKAGSPVEVKTQNVPGKTFQGTVQFVSPVSNPNSSTFPVKVTVDNKDGLLLAGMVAEVNLQGTPQSKLEVPKSALVKKDGKTFVVKVQNGTAHLVEVKTEDKNQDWVYVQPNEQLQRSEPIVVSPGDKLAEGTKVKAE
ncbi:efflux RND transporter periplasmic adaptor subunit [Paenibacillus filicis]|uniref:Efflux RND transporter periplasmic adaptor subunit n=1 Tax=Paenibacillus gyeongsangnamensis TaxID=3388067 RepID=A0ABT4Q750_9BACL|nr:efflux RND transporter periplasmic adaptor subunit [Paenibacillus filicis]MCZ8512703.1 efflux RND transporter periplasmic adaptor subunit [Paenibacillus filicis]